MQCKFIKENESQCEAMAIKESDFCFSHNPNTQEEKHLAVVKGGFASKRDVLDLEPIEVKTPKQIVGMLEETINEVRTGKLTPNIANTIGFLAGHLLKAMEITNNDHKLSLIENVLSGRKPKDK